MRETLEQQEKKKIEIEKREQNIVLFRVPESTKDSPENRQKDDIEFFSDFCINGLSCNLPEMQKDKVGRTSLVKGSNQKK